MVLYFKCDCTVRPRNISSVLSQKWERFCVSSSDCRIQYIMQRKVRIHTAVHKVVKQTV